MKRLVAALFLTLSAAPAHAGPVVVELFTSQGCSSCPPADELAGELAMDDDVLPLSLNVDYWDYLGWKDDLASPAHTARQRAYAREMGSRRIYTPQMVVQGKGDAVGSRRKQAIKMIREAESWPQPADVAFIGANTVRIAATDAIAEPCTVWAVTFTPKVERAIGRGENAGKSLTYTNVVRSWNKIAEWDGQQALTLPVTPPASGDLAIIVQRGEVGAIVGAARRGG